MINKKIIYLPLIIFGVLAISSISFAAWTAPGVGSKSFTNVLAPLNEGTDTQIKSGSLGVHGLLQVGDTLLVRTATGQSAIGTTTIGENLTLLVDGRVGASDYCDEFGDNCRPSSALGGAGYYLDSKSPGLKKKVVYVDENGNVGFNTTTPDTDPPGGNLHIVSNSGLYLYDSSTGISWISQNSDSSYDFFTSGENFYLLNNTADYLADSWLVRLLDVSPASRDEWGHFWRSKFRFRTEVLLLKGSQPEIYYNSKDQSWSNWSIVAERDETRELLIFRHKPDNPGVIDFTTDVMTLVNPDPPNTSVLVGINYPADRSDEITHTFDINGKLKSTGTNCPSDIRLKKDFSLLNGVLDKISRIRGVYFEWKDPLYEKGRKVGVIAQEVEKEFPEIVSTDVNGKKSVDYGKLNVIAVEALKEMNEVQGSKIDSLKNEQTQIKKALCKLLPSDEICD